MSEVSLYLERFGGIFRERLRLHGPGDVLDDRKPERVTGVPHLQETAPPQDPTVGLCLGS